MRPGLPWSDLCGVEKAGGSLRIYLAIYDTRLIARVMGIILTYII